jgi:hypothetical protein
MFSHSKNDSDKQSKSVVSSPVDQPLRSCSYRKRTWRRIDGRLRRLPGECVDEDDDDNALCVVSKVEKRAFLFHVEYSYNQDCKYSSTLARIEHSHLPNPLTDG